jgi:Tol biopolymer transport system component
MKLIRKILVFIVLISGGGVWGQLSLEITPITQVLVGGGFQIEGRIVHDANSSDITAGTPIQLDIQIQDPSGNTIMTNPTINLVAGFSGGRVENFSQAFQMPWSEDDKWSATARWRAVVQVSGGGSPQEDITFPLVIPDLSVSINSPTIATPGSFIDLQGSITNISVAATEPQRFFRVQASIAGTSTTETIIFPDPASFPANSPWPVVANSNLNFTIPNFFIPNTLTGPIQINVEVDPANPEIIPESNQNNNIFNHSVNVNAGTAAISTTVFFDALGTYQGLDPIKLKVVARNSGTGPVVTSDNFILTVALSQNNTFSNDDFILREIDIGGGTNALGLGLLPNETVSVDWIQQLPDNFEGDFYVLVSLNGATNPLFSSSTPEISLRSENSVDISNLTATQPDRSSHPSSDSDGNMVVYESFIEGFNQIFLHNLKTDQITLVSSGLNNSNSNGPSYAPKISADGRFVVFHSFASNLVPGDSNQHADIFIYYIYSGYIAKVTNDYNGLDANEGSFYPNINQAGTKIVFESEASNLTPIGNNQGGRQIYIYDHKTSGNDGVISQISTGNFDSFDPSIDGSGTRVVFTTHATNLITTETDINENSDIILWENGNLYFAGRAESGLLPSGGDSKEPVISSDGSTIAFQSSAANMVTGKGISYIEILDGGLGYTSNANVQISDANGTSASVSLTVNTYGEITQFVIDAPGLGYVDANLTVIPDPTVPAPTRLVNAKPRLVNPFGDIFKISVDSVKNGTGSTRVSESQKLNGLSKSETGGNQRSREPSISDDGSLIAYSTQANNMLDLNLTSTSQKTFPNLSFRPASAQAVLHAGIGKIIVSNPGTGYPSAGTFLIQDLSGNGSGAVATYQIDSLGGIGSITIQNSGSGYDLSQTIISIQNPGTGTGFTVGQILFPSITGAGNSRQGGGSVHRVEILDSGIGYPQNLNNAMQTPTIIVDGDGVDTDGDGQADSRINSDLIHFGQNGEVYLEQRFEISINNLSSLITTTLQVSDYSRMANGDQPVIISFTNSQFPPPLTVSTFINDASAIRDSLIAMINNQWTSPVNLFAGPQIDENATGGISFTLKALSGRVVSNNPSALSVKQSSNMLIQGSGFTRATAQITPAPVIHGFSEIASGMNTTTASNGRPIFQFQADLITDDIYLHNSLTSRNERISISKFGFPTNYRVNTNMPSHRFPSLSGDGRYIFFSSDAGGQGGLIFGNSNQIPTADNVRDIFTRDLKQKALPLKSYDISILKESFAISNYQMTLNTSYPIHFNATINEGSIQEVRLYANDIVVGSYDNIPSGQISVQTFLSWQNDKLGKQNLQISIIDNLENEYFSENFHVTVVENISSVYEGKLIVLPKSLNLQIYIQNPVFEPLAEGLAATFNGSYVVIGPFTEKEVSDLIAEGGVTNLFLARAYYSGQAPTQSRPFSEIYPFRTRSTQGSSLSAMSMHTGRNGKKANLKSVTYFLNGKKISEQIQPPFFTYFSPPAASDDNKSILSRWSLTSLAYDLNDNLHVSNEYGGIFLSELLPDLKLSLASGGLTGNNKILNGQNVKLTAISSGSFSTLEKVRRVHFLINGVLFASSEGVPFYTSANNIKQITYETSLDIDFERYAKPDGSISVVAIGEMENLNGYIPTFKSDPLNLMIQAPLPWIDEESNILVLYEDLTRQKPDAGEVAFTLDTLSKDQAGIAHWINDTTKMGAVSDRIDIVAAHRVVYGSWHDDYDSFENDANNYISISSNTAGDVAEPFWLKTYIDFLLASPKYTFKYVRVPHLVGSYYSSNIINYQDSRYQFINRHFVNKFGNPPSFQQRLQASYKMLQWWSTFEPTYWELANGVKTIVANGGSVQDGQKDRRDYRLDTFVSPYKSGEIAVDLIYNLALETEFRAGVPYILSTSSLRDSHFKIVALMHLLWQRNIGVITDVELAAYSKLPTIDAIKKLLADSRYTSRFNIIWSNSSSLGAEFPNWKNEDWFGNFMDASFPWIYHEDLGWIYIAGVSPTSFWFYSGKLGWLWTGTAQFPSLYSSNENNWIYFDKTKSAYYSYASNTWKPF